MMRAEEFVDSVAAVWERVYPYVGAVIGGFLGGDLLSGQSTWPPSFDAMVSALLTLSGICAGFVGVALSLLLAVHDSATISLLRKAGHFRRLIGFGAESVWLSLLACLMCCVVLWTESTVGPGVSEHTVQRPGLAAVALGVLIGEGLASYRLVRLVFRILKVNANP